VLLFVLVVENRETDFVVTVSNSNCLSSGTADAVVLQGGNYPDFTQLPGDGTVTDFNDSTSSISCTPV